jgi:plasmid stability protein
VCNGLSCRTVPQRSYNGTIVPVSLSIKHVPDDVVDRLRERAVHNKRSLQCELLDIVETAAGRPGTMTIDELYERAKRRKLPKGGPRSVDIIRKMRDAR